MPALTAASACPPPRLAPRKACRTPSWEDDPDVNLMRQAQQGDDSAFEQLRQRYAPRVFGYFCKQMRDRAEAEDLTQEVFLRLYRSRHAYKPRARFTTWLFHITQNVGRNALRSRRRRPCIQLDLETSASRTLLDDRISAPSRRLERDEVAELVRAAVAELDRRQREALELHEFHDHSYAEVAAELAMTPTAAKSLLYRARSRLREALEPLVSS